MRKGLLGSVAALAASAGLAFGQAPRGADAPVVDPTPTAVSPLAQGPAGPSYGPLPGAPLPPGMMPGGYGPPVAPEGYGPGGLFGGGAVDDNGFYLERTWLNFEYLLWKMRNGPSNWPLLVQGTIANGVNPFLPGAVTLFGGNDFHWDMSNGARVTLGGWLPGSTRVGIEAVGTISEVKTLTRAFDSGPLGIPVLGTPFINELTGAVDSLFAAAPGAPGRIYGSAKTQIYGVDLDMVGNIYRAQYFHCNVTGGFRHFALLEEYNMQYNSVGSPNGFFLGAPDAGPDALEDRFTTRNYFYGGEIGWQFQYRYRSLTLDYDNRLAMGVMHQILDVNGFSQSGGIRAPGGLFAATTNIGQRQANEFGAIPQLHGALGWQALQCLKFTAGIDFLYATSVIRPGAQIDPVVNPTLTPFRPEFGAPAGTARPTQRFVTGDFYAFGVSFGVNFRY
jgi:hypothetical protein